MINLEDDKYINKPVSYPALPG